MGTLLRIVLAGAIGLGVDESYAVAVARPFHLSYYDHPPAVFWLAGAMTELAGAHPWALRLPFILLFAGTTWMLFRLGSRLVGEWAGAYGAVAMNLAPVFSLSTASWILPDGPLLFFLVASAYCLVRALEERTNDFGWWCAAGVAGGCAGLSKYVAVLAAVGVFAFLATSPARRSLKGPGPWVALVLALLVVSPVFVWNATHAWVSFRFQIGHTGTSGFSGVHPAALATSIAGQALYLFPWIWVGLVWALVAGFLAGPRAPSWLLCWLAVGPVLALSAVALGGHPGLPHWASGGYVFAFPLLGARLAAQRTAAPRLLRTACLGAAGAFLMVVSVLGVQAATGMVRDMAPGMFRHGDPTLELVDWREVIPELERLGLGSHAHLVAAAADWIAAGKLAYALGPGVPVVCLGSAPHQFSYLYDERTFQGDDALLVVRKGTEPLAPGLTSLFQRVDSVSTVTIHQGTRPAFDLTVFLGHAFSPPGTSSP